jgi:hypothetical protein
VLCGLDKLRRTGWAVMHSSQEKGGGGCINAEGREEVITGNVGKTGVALRRGTGCAMA